ncbi:MAG TPA: DNA polymerase I [Gemmataceae bacterium]|nr:DNA polymerase I [Gemmataceae bacterium]
MSDNLPLADSRPTLVLVDAHALVHQFYHAIAPMNTPDGRPTNAVFGFARDLFFFRDELKPDYLIYVFDSPGKTFRDQISQEYKAHRKPPDDDLIAQIPLIQKLLDAAHVPEMSLPGYEADDLIATLARAGEEQGLEVLICSSDKDCRQLLTNHVRIFSLRKHEFHDQAWLLTEWGIKPEQAVDFQALVGDSVDNVKGVTGIGEKTAAKLLQKFGTIDNLLGNLDNLNGLVSAKIQANLKEAAASKSLDLGRKLVRLDANVPIQFDWEKLHWRDWDAPKLAQLFQEWGMRSFHAKARAESQKQTDLFAGMPKEPENDFAFGANAPTDQWKGTYYAVDTEAKFQAFLKDLKKQPRFAFDLETTGLDPLNSELVGMAVCWQAGQAFYLPVRAPEGEHHLDEATTLAALKPILENPKVAKVNQNIKFDQNAFCWHGIKVAGVAGDSMVADYLLRSGERSHNLDELALRYFQHQNISYEDVAGKGKKQKTLDQVEVAKVTQYSGEDADVAWRLAELLEPELEREGLEALYDELEVPLIEVLSMLECTGVRLDVSMLARLSKEMDQQLQLIEKEIHSLGGRVFNIASPKQLGEILFTELKLPVQKKTGLTGAASTDQETLERLAVLGHDIPKKIIEHRQISKLKGTYVDALPALINPYTGRVHTKFNQSVAATGRLSSSEPNLQNIPARTDQGKQIRQAFLPAEGWTLLTADYSQVELRLLAQFCGDEALRQAFADDRDVHAAVASQIFGVKEEQVTSSQRRVAKTVNFGVLYGMSAHGLAQRLGIPREEASQFIDQYFARYPKVLDYQTKLLNACRKDGVVKTILGRRRTFDKSTIRAHSTYQGRNQAEREAINMEIQGSAADLIKKAMLGVHRRLKDEKRQARMLLTVHDELVFEVPSQELQDVAEMVRAEMCGAIKLDVPLKVDVAAGANWLDVEDLKS